jgi:hypothetical protein
MRACYRCLLQLHPPAFRRQFAGEMLWIFDEAAESQGACALVRDGLASLARQWLLRSGWWKTALALLLALAQVTFALQFSRHIWVSPALDAPLAGTGELAHRQLTIGVLMCLAVFVTAGLIAMVLGLTVWFRFFQARRVR